MSVSDELMWRYFELLSFRPMGEIEKMRRQVEEGGNPRDAKVELAKEIVARFHSPQQADQAEESFVNRFRKGAIPDEMNEVAVEADGGVIAIANLLKQAGLTASTSDAMRMIRQKAVKIDGEAISDTRLKIDMGTTKIYQVGKRKFARVTVK
jgi:tyrosyl-tRNA synthetase